MRGGPTRDIQAQLADLYGVEISPTLVSNIADKLLPRITEWQQRPLAACYPVVFLERHPLQSSRGRPGGQQSCLHGGGH